jgi:hypothetical protein
MWQPYCLYVAVRDVAAILLICCSARCDSHIAYTLQYVMWQPYCLYVAVSDMAAILPTRCSERYGSHIAYTLQYAMWQPYCLYVAVRNVTAILLIRCSANTQNCGVEPDQQHGFGWLYGRCLSWVRLLAVMGT